MQENHENNIDAFDTTYMGKPVTIVRGGNHSYDMFYTNDKGEPDSITVHMPRSASTTETQYQSTSAATKPQSQPVSSANTNMPDLSIADSYTDGRATK